MNTKQPYALCLAEKLQDAYNATYRIKAVAELRRQHAEIETLRAGYDAARLEIASLRAQLAAIGAGGVEPLRKRECLHQISEPAQAAPASIITASVMRDDGGEHPAFCLMVAYRTEKDAKAALAILADAPALDAQNEVKTLLRKYRNLCLKIGRGDSQHIARIDAAIAAQRGGEHG